MPFQIDEKEVVGVVGILGVIGGWLIAGFRKSKKIGREEERIDGIEQRVDSHEISISTLKKDHDEDMRMIRAFFSTENGGQKFMTFPDHDTICMINSRTTAQEIGHLTKAIVDNTTKVSVVSDQVRLLQVSVAVLQENKNIRNGESRDRRTGD